MKKIYLDYAATTPVDKRVLKTMSPYFSKKFGNTTSVHSFGQEAKEALETSRKTIADFIGAKLEEIIFTGSATESNNTVLKGIALASKKKKGQIIISSIEHPSIEETAKSLEKLGFKITRLPVDKYGLVSPKLLNESITKDTILVSIIHASNEIGTIQPIAEIGKICRDSGVLFHTDVVQSFGKVPIDVGKMNIDLLTASSHKIYGPKGIACLYVKRGTKIKPLLSGGAQEFNMRSSTVNVAGVVGFAEAVKIYKKEGLKENKRLRELRDKIIKSVLKIEGSRLNGSPIKRLSNNANFSILGAEGEAMLLQLDLKGIAVSTGSSCSSTKLEPSHVLLATGLKHQEAHGSLRVTLGRFTTIKEVDYFLHILPSIIKNLRKISGNFE